MTGRSPFVGRSVEVERLRLRIGDAIAGRPAFILVGGEAGVGKSRLVDEVTSEAERDGLRVLRGLCVDVAGDGLPFEPFVDALSGLASALGPDRLVELVGPIQPELERLMPNLGTAATGAGDAPLTATTKGRLFELGLGFFERLTVDRPAVLVIEDAQWADEASRDLLRFLIRRLRHRRMALVITFRTDALGRGHPLRHLLAEVERDDATTRIDVPRFDREDVRRLMTILRGAAPSTGEVDAVLKRSDGNPFFVEELVAAGPNPAIEIPQALSDVLLDRVSRLGQAARAAVDAAAVLGVGFDERDAAMASGLHPDEASAAIREAIEAGVLEPTADGGSAIRFRHALVREAVELDLLPAERRRLHAAAGDIIDGAALAEPITDAGRAARLAYHRLAAGQIAAALIACIRAGDALMGVFAFADARTQYERALRLWEQVDRPTESTGVSSVAVARRAAEAAWLDGDARAAADRISGTISGIDPTEEGSLAELFECLGRYLSDAGDLDGARVAYDQSRSHDEGQASDLAARLEATEAQMDMLAGRFAASRERATAAVRMATDRGAPAIVGHARCTLGVDLVFLGDPDAGLAEIREARRIATDPVRPDDLGRAFLNEGLALWHIGRLSDCVSVSLEGQARLEPLGLGPTIGRDLASNAAATMVYLGRWQEADDIASSILAEDVGGLTAVHMSLVRAHLGLLRGEWHQAERDIDAARRRAAPHGHAGFAGDVHAVSADLAVWRGDPSAALASARAGIAALGDSEDAGLLARLLAIGTRAAVDLVLVARSTRRTADEREAEAAVAGFAESVDDLSRAPGGGTPLARAYTANVRAEAGRLRPAGADAAWLEAAARWTDLEVPMEVAVARWRAAAARLSSRAPRGDATTWLVDARRVATDLGAAPLLAEIDDLARRARIDLVADDDVARPARREPDRPSAPLGLSAREIEVLELVDAGRTNRQIAEALFISEKTAGAHVSNILAKLGVSNRVEAAGLARRAGVLGPPQESIESGMPAVEKTFLFTDVVGSTALLEVVGDEAWTALRAWHDTTLRKLFGGFGGTEIDHAGDGFFVVFDLPGPAIRCAIAIQRVLAAQRRASGFAPNVRLAVHRGSARRSGPGFTGRDVHLAARLLDHAAAGQIVATAVTIDALGDQVSATTTEVVELRGIEGRVGIARVSWR